jgi:glycosyltransferase involved in cell wall biosynthesis
MPGAPPIVTDPAPRVSVVVAARNAETTLGACLASLGALDYPHVELVVADDGSTDGTLSVARNAGARVVDARGQGPSAARNQAVASSTADVVAFTDADCTVPPEWLRLLVEALQAPGVASAGGPQRNVFAGAAGGDNLAIEAFFRLASVVAEYTRHDDRPRIVAHNASCNSAYRRDAFLEVGGFAEGLWPGEDVDLDHRLAKRGHRAIYVPGAFVWHHRPGGLPWLRRMMRRYGWAQGELVRRHGPFRPLHATPVALALAVAAQGLLAVPAARAGVIALDAAVAAATLAMLVRVAPPRLWLPVVRAAAWSVVEWNLGYLDGLGRRRHKRS